MDKEHGWIVGVPFGSLILRTTDGGETWTMQSHGSPETLEGVVFSDANHGWAVGWRGSILHFKGPLETVPPQTEAENVPVWTNKNVVITLQASDSESGVGWTVYYLDDSGRRFGSLVEYEVDAEGHSKDGLHILRYFSIDNAGNRETEHNTSFGVDTRPPWTVGQRVQVRRGKMAGLPYNVRDKAPNGGTAVAEMIIHTVKGRIVKRFTLGTVAVNRKHVQRFRCNLPKGLYRYRVTAVDAAGNKERAVKAGRLVVQ